MKLHEWEAENNLHLRTSEVLAMREMAKRNYWHFLQYKAVCTKTRIKWAWFHEYLADVMQSVTMRQRRRVIVNIPPRHLKSTLISQDWQAWMIGRDDSQNSSLLSTTATATLAARDSRRTLDVLRADWYRALFPHVMLTRENEVEWETKSGAYRIAVGRDGTLTGRGAAHISIDDLVLAAEASSEVVREKANDWVGESLITRLNDPKTDTITVIQQRLHERDTTGYLLNMSKIEGADQYEHIVLPLIAEKKTIIFMDGKHYHTREVGELLHEDRISNKEVASLKIVMRNNFDGQYQQNPIKQTGGMLDPTKLIRIDATAPELIHRFGLRPNAYIDFATREKQTQRDDPDFSAIMASAKDQLGRIFFLDLFYKQCDFETLGRTLIGMYKAYNFRFVKGEKGALINTFQPLLIMQQKQTGTFFPLFPIKGAASRGDKVSRSATFQGMLNAGMICVPAHAPWLPALEKEMRSFPNGVHDDLCDVAAYTCADSQELMQGEAPIKQPTDERELMDEMYKQDLYRKINEAKYAQTQDSYCASIDDW